MSIALLPGDRGGRGLLAFCGDLAIHVFATIDRGQVLGDGFDLGLRQVDSRHVRLRAVGQRAARACEVMLVVGTSGQVQPAGGLATLARQAGARVVVVNPEPTHLDAVAHAILAGPSARLIPELLDF